MDQESKITEERLPEVGNPNPIVERKHINQIRKIAAKMKLDSQEKASKENQRNSPDMKDTKKNRPKSGYPRLKYECIYSLLDILRCSRGISNCPL